MISLIVPIYNAEAYLAQCIESLLAQTVRDVQVLLIDDDSIDSSLAIAKRYAAEDARIKVLQQKHAGQSAARNLGMQHAEGEYIAFVDADDRLEADWCEQHLAAIERADYVQSGYKRVQKESLKVLQKKLPIHRYQFTSPCMRLYRKKTIEDLHFEVGYIYEDVLFSADLWKKGMTCRMIHDTGYLYTLNPLGTTSVPHPEERRQVLSALKNKLHGASLKTRLILWYTILRLQLYFIVR